MAERNVVGSSTELTAVKMNLKESRVLDKSVQTLSLEESYASKLLELDKKMVRFNYGRLKTNVNKIRSHLEPEQILSLRNLELEGKLKSDYPMICSSSNSTKIAAAERRLKLSTYRRVQSALPTRTSESNDDDTTVTCDETLDSDGPRISRSTRVRPKTTMCLSRKNSEDILAEEKKSPTTPRPKSTAFLLEQISKAHRKHKRKATPATFSCHEDKPEDEDEKGKNILDHFGPNPYEERRKKLINMEGKALEEFSQKKAGFVDHVEKFVEANPMVTNIEPEMTQTVINSIDSMAARPESSIYDKLSKHIDVNLVKKALYTPDKFEREYYTIQMMRRGKMVQPTVEDLFVPARYKMA